MPLEMFTDIMIRKIGLLFFKRWFDIGEVVGELDQLFTSMGPVRHMPTPRLNEKRWSVDLEKKIQSEHSANSVEYTKRYGFNPDSGKEIFVIDTPPPYPQEHGILEPSHNIP